MGNRRVKRYRVKIRELFPSADPVVPHLLRVMAAANDVHTLMKLYLQSTSRAGETQSERETITSEDVYLFRMMCGTVYEAALVFLDFEREVRQGERTHGEELVASLDRRSRDAFLFLENIFQHDIRVFEKGDYGKILVQARNHSFHYDKPENFATALREHDEIGELIMGEVAAVGRYLLADDLQVQIMFKPIAIDLKTPEQVLRAKLFLKTTTEVSRALASLADAWIARYSNRNPNALVESIQETVLEERLWNICPEAARSTEE